MSYDTNERPSDEVTEEWKSIPGYEGLYEVSSFGNLRSLDRMRSNGSGTFFQEGQTLRIQRNSYGYGIIRLSKNGKHRTQMVHQLVATAFVPNPDSKKLINHIDGDKANNHYLNIEWCDHSENLRHAYKAGLRPQKLSDDDVREIRQRAAQGDLQRDIAADFGVGQQYVSRLVNRKKRSDI